MPHGMSCLLLVESRRLVRATQKAVGAKYKVLALPGQAADYLPPTTEAALDYFEPRRRVAASSEAQHELQQSTLGVAEVFLAFPAGGRSEALAAVVQKLIHSAPAPNGKAARILRLALEPGEVATPAQLATAGMVDFNLARAYHCQQVLEDLLRHRVADLEVAAREQYQAEIGEICAQVAAGRADARSAIHDFRDRLGTAPPAAEDEVPPAGPVCPRCGRGLVTRQAAQGRFTGCSGYPKCTFILEASTGVSCPRCLRGHLVERRNEQARVFYGCTQFPECRFTSTRKPVAGPCPACGNRYLVEQTLKSGSRVVCPRAGCGFRQVKKR